MFCQILRLRLPDVGEGSHPYGWNHPEGENLVDTDCAFVAIVGGQFSSGPGMGENAGVLFLKNLSTDGHAFVQIDRWLLFR